MTFPRICWTAVPASFPQIHERCWCRTGISTASCLRHLSPCVSVFVYCKCRFMLQRGSSIQNVRKNNLHPPLLQLILWSRCGIVLYLSLLLSSQQKYSIFLIKYDILMHHIFDDMKMRPQFPMPRLQIFVFSAPAPGPKFRLPLISLAHSFWLFFVEEPNVRNKIFN